MQPRVARSRTPLSWDDLQVFLALSRTKSLVAGARSMGIDKSTASRRLAALERAVGAELFARTREGLRVSSLGDRLRAYAERVEADVRVFESEAVAGDDEVSGLVRIATTEAMAARLVQGGLLDLRASYPDLDIEVLGGNRPVDLAAGEADLAVRVTPSTDASLKVRVIARFGISLFAAPSYLRDRGMPRTPAQLLGHDILLPSGELGKLPETAWLLQRTGIRVVFRSSSLPALVEAAVRGHGICAVTRAWGEAVPGLSYVMDIDTIKPRPVWLVFQPDVGKRPAVRVVADRIGEAFRALGR